jgi:hypothetical protein
MPYSRTVHTSTRTTPNTSVTAEGYNIDQNNKCRQATTTILFNMVSLYIAEKPLPKVREMWLSSGPLISFNIKVKVNGLEDNV